MVLPPNLNEMDRTKDVRVSQNITFESLLLSPSTLSGLKSSGFYRPSPIQLQGIPLGKCGFDLLLEAKSGTGKTAVFLIIALEKLDLEKGLQTIILTPTREIAVQICDVMHQIGSGYKELKTMAVIGGMPVQEDIMKIKSSNIHVVVGSPGRLRHLIQDKHLDISAVRLMVLDEADKLIEKSFQADINYIFAILPKQKQVIMSSATYPENSKPFIEKYVQNAQHVCPENNSVLLGVKQNISIVKHNSNVVKQTQYRFIELLKILSQKQFKQCLIFCNYQTRVIELNKMLNKQHWPSEQLYGQQEQSDRLDSLKMLQEYKCRILISTDLAARGIDASNVDLVVNFEPPIEWQTYLHRIGRAGRFGSYGIAVTILSEGKEENSFKQILEFLQVPVHHFWNDNETNLDTPPLEKIETKPVQKSIGSCDKDHNVKKVWSLLTANVIKNENELESFEDLYKSFQGARPHEEIESFSGLMCSFQTHQSNIKCIKTNNPLELVQEQMKVTKEYCNLIENAANLRNIQSLNVKRKNDDSKQLNDKHCETLNDLSNGYHNNKDTHIIDTKTNAILNSELPTSFGKKHKKRFGFRKKDYTQKEKTQEWVNKTKLNAKLIEAKDTNDTLDQDRPSDNTNKNTNSPKNHETLCYSCINHKLDIKSNSDKAIKYVNDELSKQNYIDWYNQLKSRVREIEYAVYIQEMSTLWT